MKHLKLMTTAACALVVVGCALPIAEQFALPSDTPPVATTDLSVIDWDISVIDTDATRFDRNFSTELSPWVAPDAETASIPATVATESALVAIEYADLVTPLHHETSTTKNDLWSRIRNGYALPKVRNARVDQQLKWFTNNPEYIERVVERARPYLHHIVERAEYHGVPLEMALLPVVESAFQPFAYSHGRAAGLWQFIPSTGRMYGLKQNWWYDGRRDVVAATDAALSYLKKLSEMMQGDWLLALASYNAGAGNVLRAKRSNTRKGKPTDFWSLNLPEETSAYVPKLIAVSLLFENPEDYGLQLASVPNEPYFGVVEVGSQIDLALAAELADLEMEEIYRLNPAFNRWATDPNGPHQLVLPVDHLDDFKLALAELPPRQRVNWRRHKIRTGESLLSIAKKFQTTVEVIRDVNQIRGSNIRAGNHLMIPVATKSLDSYQLSQTQRDSRIKNAKRSGSRVEHVVSSGESFWEISRRYGVNVRALARWNAMAPTDTLKAGQKLVVWTKQRVSNSSKTGAAIAADLPVDTQRKIRYTVRNGDSLARISQKFRVRVNDLLRWNGLSAKSYIHPGQKITLFVDVRTQSGLI